MASADAGAAGAFSPRAVLRTFSTRPRSRYALPMCPHVRYTSKFEMAGDLHAPCSDSVCAE